MRATLAALGLWVAGTGCLDDGVAGRRESGADTDTTDEIATPDTAVPEAVVPETVSADTTPEISPADTTPEISPADTTPETSPADTTPETSPPDTTPETSPPDTSPGETVATGCLTDPSPGHRSVTCGDIVFEVEIPPGCGGGACGLILDIHGWTMSADLEDANTLMRERGRGDGFVVIQPSAPLSFGIPTWNLDTHAAPIFTFTRDVAALVGTDPGRAFVMGFSQGGALTWQLVCAHADFFAAAAPLGALPGCGFEGADAPAREVDMLVVHGRKDTVVALSLFESQRDAALAGWPLGGATIISQDDGHLATRWTTPSGTTFETWEHDYTATSFLLNGHCFPGSPHVQALPLAFGCQESGTFSYGEIAFAFFAAHPGR